VASELSAAPAPIRPDAVLARRGGAVELLWIPAAVFLAASELRRRLYDARVLRSGHVDAPVVCLGNLTAGGTGKSPFALWLARWFQARGLRPGLLSRGYRAARGGVGDETRMLAARLVDVLHVEDPDRLRGARALVERGVDVVLLDDGFQHRRLARDLDFVLIDATRPFGLPWDAQGRAPAAPLPRGLLRERPAALARANAIVVTRSDQVDPARLRALLERLEREAPGVPIAEAVHRPVALLRADGARLDLARLRGESIDLVSGIGNPDAFENTVRTLGARVSEHRRFPDHHAYGSGDLAGLGAGGRMLVTTHKDAVKLAQHGQHTLVLEVDFELRAGRAAIEALLEALAPARARVERAAIHTGLHG